MAEGENGGKLGLPADGAGRGTVKEERSGRFNLKVFDISKIVKSESYKLG